MQRLLIGFAALAVRGSHLQRSLRADRRDGICVTRRSRCTSGVAQDLRGRYRCTERSGKTGDPRQQRANPLLNRIVYWLAVERDTGADPAAVIDQAQALNNSAGTPRAPLVKASFLRNLKIFDGLGMLTPINWE